MRITPHKSGLLEVPTNFSLDPKAIERLSEILSGGQEHVFCVCASLAMRNMSLEPLEKLRDLGFTPDAISELYAQCDENVYLMALTLLSSSQPFVLINVNN
jgi:hypothetical protein